MSVASLRICVASSAIICASCASLEPLPLVIPDDATPQERFLLTFNHALTYPCASPLTFRKAWLVGWQIGCEGCASYPIDFVYPKDKNKIVRELESIGAGDDVPFRVLAGCW